MAEVIIWGAAVWALAYVSDVIAEQPRAVRTRVLVLWGALMVASLGLTVHLVLGLYS